MPLGFCGADCLCTELCRTDAHSDCLEKRRGFLTCRGGVKIHTINTEKQLGATGV